MNYHRESVPWTVLQGRIREVASAANSLSNQLNEAIAAVRFPTEAVPSMHQAKKTAQQCIGHLIAVQTILDSYANGSHD